jgi:putative FmdB family regulatory protein
MPTYQYQCRACGYEIEELQSMSEPPLIHCPHCHTDNLARVMGTGAGLIFKGSGFYLTDYKKESGESKGKSKPKKHTDEKKPTGSGEKGTDSSSE